MVRHTVDGTVWIFLCEALALPTGFLIVVFLTRRFGPDGYGLYTLAAVLIGWIEAFVRSLFHYTTIKLVSEAKDWKPVAAGLTQMHLLTGCLLACVLFGLATPIATLMGEPVLTDYLRLFVLDLPIFALVLAHKSILVALGEFRQRAVTSGARFMARFILIALLVELGFSIPGAIWGNIGATLAELAICRYYVRPPFLNRALLPIRRLLRYSAPLSACGMVLQVFGRMDLIVLTAMGGTAALAGVYAAAQNLSTIPPGILAVSFSPLLLATLSRLLIAGQELPAKRMSLHALRAVVALLPFAAMVSGASAEITLLVYGTAYASASQLLGILVFGALAMVFVSVTGAILTAAGKPAWLLLVVGPLLPLAAVGYLVFIPQFGALGAALATTLGALGGAFMGVLAIHRLWALLPPSATLFRSLLVSGAAFALASGWPTSGMLLAVKLVVVVLMIIFFYWLLGEITTAELARLAGLLRREQQPGSEPGIASEISGDRG